MWNNSNTSNDNDIKQVSSVSDKKASIIEEIKKDKQRQIAENLNKEKNLKDFTMKVGEEEGRKKVIKDNEFKNLDINELWSTIWEMHKKIEWDSLVVSIEKNPNLIYRLKDNITLIGRISSKEYFLEVEERGALSDFFDKYKKALETAIENLNLNKNIQESFDINSRHQEFYVFDEKDQIDWLTDETTPTQFMHDSNFIYRGKSNF